MPFAIRPQQSARPDVADWNQSLTGTSRENSLGRKYRAVTLLRRAAIVAQSVCGDTRLSAIYVRNGNRVPLKQTGALAVAVAVPERFEFPQTISKISYNFFFFFNISISYRLCNRSVTYLTFPNFHVSPQFIFYTKYIKREKGLYC